MRRIFTAALLYLASVGPTPAAVLEFGGILDGAEEVPATATNGNGVALFLFDDVTNLLTWNVSFHDLSGTVSGSPAAGVYRAAAGSTGPLVFALDGSNPNTIVDGSGLSEGMFLGYVNLAPTLVSDLLGGGLYLNIHTTAFAGGEIRTQLLPATVTVVPLPAAAWLMLGALGGLVGVTRRT